MWLYWISLPFIWILVKSPIFLVWTKHYKKKKKRTLIIVFELKNKKRLKAFSKAILTHTLRIRNEKVCCVNSITSKFLSIWS